MVVNRITDLFFTIGIVTIFYLFQTVEFSTLLGLATFLNSATVLFISYDVPALQAATMLLFLGAMGKSAQIGFHT